MELYLSDFTAFLEIWVGSILLLMYNSKTLNIEEYIIRIIKNQVKDLLEDNEPISDESLSDVYLRDEYLRKYYKIHNNYQEFFQTQKSLVLSLKQIIKRLEFIALVALVYGLIIVFYLGIEKKFPSIYPILIVTNILVFLYILLLCFVNDKHIKTITYSSFILLFCSIILILWFTHTCLTTAMNIFFLSRSIITIFTLITCCFSLFIVLYIRFITFKFQSQDAINKLKKLQNEEFQKFESKYRELFQNEPNGLEEKKDN